MRGWLVNDSLTCIPGTRTLWHYLLDGLNLYDHTGTPFPYLAQAIGLRLSITPTPPDIIIRNGSYFGPIDTDVPQIVLIQDILTGPLRTLQIEVARKAQLVVYNSEFTRSFYPELDPLPSRVIPLGVDSELFTILPDIERERRILFIGSRDAVKGFDVLMDLIQKTPYQFTVVTKDAPVVHPRVSSYVGLPHHLLVRVINSCRLGLCLSRMETQHLAGIEMGLCGVPLLATPVGAYFFRPDGAWGRKIDHDTALEALDEAMMEDPCPPEEVRKYWLEAAATIEGCITAWKEAVSACLSR